MANPTVTVVVYTYNSSKYVKETLDSIKAQTYPDLKLIVSDDCSTDNTLQIVRKWVAQNGSRFVSTKILTVDKNTGPSANSNRGWDACDTEWLKDIAGDDILMPNCIRDNVDYITEHPDAIAVFSKIEPFSIINGRKKIVSLIWLDYSFFSLSKEEQLASILRTNHIPASSAFYDIDKLRMLGISHDERIPLLEDYPKWITLLKKGIGFDYLDKTTIEYRVHKESLTGGIRTPDYFKSMLLFYLYYYLEEIKSMEDRNDIYYLICKKAVSIYSIAFNSVSSLDYRVGHFVMAPIHFGVKATKKIVYTTKVIIWRMLHLFGR